MGVEWDSIGVEWDGIGVEWDDIGMEGDGGRGFVVLIHCAWSPLIVVL